MLENKIIDNKKNESFIRWQGRAIEQLGFVNNLFILLATGMLVFQIQIAVKNDSDFTILEKHIFVFSLLLIFLSLLLGGYSAWNRLNSFQKTASVARKREKGITEDIEKLRKEYRALDKRTWCLLRAQIISFVTGALILIIFAIITFRQDLQE